MTPLHWLIDFLESNGKLCDKTYKKQLVSQSQHYLIQEGILYHVDTLDYVQLFPQVVTPDIYKKSVLYSMHNAPLASHTGCNKTDEKLRQQFFWVRTWKDVKHWTENCQKPSSSSSENLFIVGYIQIYRKNIYNKYCT